MQYIKCRKIGPKLRMKKESKSGYGVKIEELIRKIPDVVLCIFMKRLLVEFVVRAGIRNILPPGDFVVG